MRLSHLLAAALLLSPMAARADDVTDQIENARKAYEAGDISGAITELEFATQALKGKVGQFYRATFPAAPAGWTATDEDDQGGGMAGIMGGTVIARNYSMGDKEMKASLMSGGGMMQGLAQMFMNPQFMTTQPNAKRVRIGRETAVVTYDPSDRKAQLMMDVGGKVTISIEGINMDNGDALVDLANKWDVKKVREIAGL